MLSEPLRNLEIAADLVVAVPGTSVADAAGLMLARSVAALLVVDADTLLGIFTEHDIATRVVALGRDPQAVEIGEVMTREPLTVGPDSTLGHALLVMHENAIRHLPVLENGKPVGIVCARDALDPALEDFVCEEHRRDSFR